MLTDRRAELLGNLGYDPTYGARPLKRVIQKQLVDKLALAMLDGGFAEGDTVEVDVADGALSFTKVEERRAAVARLSGPGGRPSPNSGSREPVAVDADQADVDVRAWRHGRDRECRATRAGRPC